MTPTVKCPVAILGSGDVGTDLMMKILRSDGPLTVGALVGLDPEPGGLARAERLGVPTSPAGIDGLPAMPEFGDIGIVFDATPAGAPRVNRAELEGTGLCVLDLNPAVVGPHCVPAVNLEDHLDTPNLNLVTGAGQATVPIVAAVGRVGAVSYAETVTSVAAKSADPATRATIDESIETTAAALRTVGGARRARAIFIINPADPPILMRNTVYCLVDGDVPRGDIEQSIAAMVDRVTSYVPGYRLKQRVQFETFTATDPLHIPETGGFTGTRVTVLVEVTAGEPHLPGYAGNLEMMTSAAKAAAERIALHRSRTAGAAT
ncbi:acetaldehyde dehydrogenase (acetylating) [Mycobacterium sp. TJFP1]